MSIVNYLGLHSGDPPFEVRDNFLIPELDFGASGHSRIHNFAFQGEGAINYCHQLLPCLVYRCTGVPMYCVPVDLYQYAGIPVYQDIGVPVCRCTSMPMFGCTCALVRRCTNVSVYRCAVVPVYRYTDIPVYCFIHVAVYRCTGVPVCWCTGIPGYWCTCVPVYRCTSNTTSAAIALVVTLHLQRAHRQKKRPPNGHRSRQTATTGSGGLLITPYALCNRFASPRLQLVTRGHTKCSADYA